MLRHGLLIGLYICDINNLRNTAPFSSLSKRKAESVFSRALLFKSLAAVFELKTLPDIIFDENGKPCFKEACGIHFSLSHSGDFVAAAVSDVPCGVDIEKKKPRPERFIKKIMENEILDTEFYELWCLKEAYFKLMGTGGLLMPSGIFLKDEKICGPDGSSVGKVFTTVPGYALAVFSFDPELPDEPLIISSEELFDLALCVLDMRH